MHRPPLLTSSQRNIDRFVFPSTALHTHARCQIGSGRQSQSLLISLLHACCVGAKSALEICAVPCDVGLTAFDWVGRAIRGALQTEADLDSSQSAQRVPSEPCAKGRFLEIRKRAIDSDAASAFNIASRA